MLECVRSMRCQGNCDDECSISDYDGSKSSSGMQEDEGSALDECVENVHCPGNCEHVRKGYTVLSKTMINDGSNNANYPEWHTGPGITFAAG